MDGPAGELERRQAACVRRWGLRLGARLAGGHRSHVRECTTAGGEPAVLKLTATVDAATLEARALSCWRDTGAAVRLLDADPAAGALLLERLRPATALPGGDGARTVEVAVDLLARLHSVAAVDGFPDLADHYPHLARTSIEDNRYERAARGEPDRAAAALRLMGDAERAARVLCATSPARVLLHGDLLDKNVLRDGDRYVAVDPQPRLGEPEAEIGCFACHHPPVAGILDRAATIARRLGADPGRAARWAAIWAVLLATSAWRDDQPELDALVAAPRLRELLNA